MANNQRAIVLCALIAAIHMASSASINQSSCPSSSSSSGLFAADLIAQLTKTKASENVVFSPISIQTVLALTYLGAEGKTAEELSTSLRLPSTNKDKVGEYFAQLLSKKSGEATLVMANKIFASSDYPLKEDFNDKAAKYFNSSVEALNFKSSPTESIEAINTWVEDKTNNKITNLMKPGSVDADTVALIVNAIYFKGEWREPFSQDLTHKRPFWISASQSVNVDTMVGSDKRFNYGEFPELDAVAVELPYKDSDLSMMLILPSKKDGLADLEKKLGSTDINVLSSRMVNRKVDLFIPKFKIDFSTGLSSILKEMGIVSLFQKADLPGMFQSGPNVKVSDVQHKAFIEVNEAGSEAAAASFLQISLMSLDYDLKTFNVDRPFFFAIKDNKTVYFAGHVVELN